MSQNFIYLKVGFIYVLTYRLAEMMQRVFGVTCLLQIILTTPFLAVNIYKASRTDPSDPYFVTCFTYFSTVVGQLLFYCWYGNEVLVEVSRMFFDFFFFSSIYFPSNYYNFLIFMREKEP